MSLAGCCLCVAAATVAWTTRADAQVFPGDAGFTATGCGGGPSVDPLGDESPAWVDLVGDESNPSTYIGNDADFFYTRMRLAADPRQGGGFRQVSWSWGVDTDGNLANGFELLINLDGVAEEVELLDINDVGTPLWSTSASTHALAVPAPSNLGGNGMDWFLMVAMPIDELNAAGAVGALTVWVGTSANATGIQKDWNCFDGEPGDPSEVPADPVELPTRCLSDNDCGGNRPFCDPGTELCVACMSNMQCQMLNPLTPLCAPSGACVACVDDDDCGSTSPICDSASRVCRACAGDNECTAPDAPLCAGSGACVECTSNGDCPGTACDVGNGTCGVCTIDADCIDAQRPACEMTSGGCVECTPTMDVLCDNPTPICSGATFMCEGCTMDAQCGGATPLCEVASGACVGCLTDNDCGGTTPVCDGDTQTCRPCASDNDCNLVGAQVCDVGGACVGCVDDNDCNGVTPVCEAGTNTCRACATDAECNDPSAPECGASGACAECNDDGDCPGSSCNLTTGTCGVCVSDADCVNPLFPACDLGSGGCVECTQTMETLCVNPRPTCSVATNVCVPCSTDLDCGGDTPLCNVASGSCVGCLSEADCGLTTPVCDNVNETCRACATDADCTSPAMPVCAVDGACVEATATDAGPDGSTDAGLDAGSDASTDASTIDAGVGAGVRARLTGGAPCSIGSQGQAPGQPLYWIAVVIVAVAMRRRLP